MDNDSTGGNDKRSWRDRLGIGTKELPKLSDDFKSVPKEQAVKPVAVRTAPSLPSSPSPGANPALGAARPAPRPAQAVVKPAPMAPRTPPKVEARITPKLEVRPAQPVNNEAFAERLRSQREAAEKVAEQRVLAARQKAEQAAAQRNGQTVIVPKTTSEDARPKYIFADEEVGKISPTELPPLPKRTAATVTTSLAPSKAVTAPPSPLPPPRPPLGVDRPTLPPRPAAPVQQPAAPAFRPLEGMSGTYAPPPPLFPQRQYTAPPATTRPPMPQRPPYVGNNTIPQADHSDSEFNGTGHGYAPEQPSNRPPRPTLRGPMSGPGGLPSGPYTDDIFEQPPQRPQRRVTAGEYQNAYRDTDAAYEYDQPRSNGPWVLLLLLALVAALTGAGVWFYQTQWLNQIATPGGATPTQQQAAPVVQPPAEPSKSEPEVPMAAEPAAATDTNANAGAQSVVPPSTKKQIYDRIVGDREVLGGQLQSTEEPPVAPEVQIEEAVEPISGEGQAPAQGTNGETITDDGEPLPLPPPPGQQGAIEDPPPAGQSAATVSPAAGVSQAADASLASQPIVQDGAQDSDALARTTEQLASEPPPQSLSANSSTALIEPPPAEPPAVGSTSDTPAIQEQAAAAPAEPSETITDEPVAPPTIVASEPAKESVPVAPAKPAKAKVVKLAPKKKPTPVQDAQVGKAKTLVPSEDASVDDTNILYGDTATATAAEAPVQTKKRRTLFDLLENKDAVAPAQSSEDQVATLQPAPARRTLLAPSKPAEPAVQQTPPPAAGNGYVAQLASFRSQSEATHEFARMKGRHPSILGNASPVVSEVTVAGSKRFRLAVGPMANRESASRLCSQLIQAGERDCIAKRR